LPTKVSEQKRKQRIIISIELIDAERSARTERAFVDSDIESNYILQTLVIKYKLTPKVKDIDLAIIKGKEIFIYNIYSFNFIIINIYKTTKNY